jgi:hypothetical protein
MSPAVPLSLDVASPMVPVFKNHLEQAGSAQLRVNLMRGWFVSRAEVGVPDDRGEPSPARPKPSFQG